jgi:RNA polymerase sigma-70 factor (ECF subfamily)
MDPHARSLDRAELATMFERYGERLYRYCLRLLGCPDDAADAMQDAFANLARRRTALPGDETAQRVYMFTVARNACFDLRRRRRGHVDLDSLLRSGVELACDDPAGDPVLASAARSSREQIGAALERVPRRQRTAWLLRERSGLSCDEIGERLAIQPNAVAQLLHRARRSLLATPEIQALYAARPSASVSSAREPMASLR